MRLREGQQLPQRRWEQEGEGPGASQKRRTPSRPGQGHEEVEEQRVERHSPGWCPQWLELRSFHPRVRLPVKGCRFCPGLDMCGWQPVHVSLPSVFLPPSLLPFHSKNQ